MDRGNERNGSHGVGPPAPLGHLTPSRLSSASAEYRWPLLLAMWYSKCALPCALFRLNVAPTTSPASKYGRCARDASRARPRGHARIVYYAMIKARRRPRRKRMRNRTECRTSLLTGLRHLTLDRQLAKAERVVMRWGIAWSHPIPAHDYTVRILRWHGPRIAKSHHQA
jgi:hypothetical protein